MQWWWPTLAIFSLEIPLWPLMQFSMCWAEFKRPTITKAHNTVLQIRPWSEVGGVISHLLESLEQTWPRPLPADGLRRGFLRTGGWAGHDLASLPRPRREFLSQWFQSPAHSFWDQWNTARRETWHLKMLGIYCNEILSQDFIRDSSNGLDLETFQHPHLMSFEHIKSKQHVHGLVFQNREWGLQEIRTNLNLAWNHEEKKY